MWFRVGFMNGWNQTKRLIKLNIHSPHATIIISEVINLSLVDYISINQQRATIRDRTFVDLWKPVQWYPEKQIACSLHLDF